ncbi:hypothetical protein DHEL01_v205873 [Diaporthe helianthi]|uniref:Uncharacterized protein n=1 Tax=Diaporthe helianthi TaxID=158607 RepID=A0A2P5HZN5_DIAHE|nr:hypothetical protein DHEL01_v205873 [Diaporthe helianthi]
MGGCTSREERRDSDRRTVKRMAQLGYRTEDPIPGRHPLRPGELLHFTTVRNSSNKIIAILGAALDGFLIVTTIYTVRDDRDRWVRPLASDILLSYWKNVAGNPLREAIKLARCVNTMATEYIEMKHVGAGVSSIDFVPQDMRGINFHLVVELGYTRLVRPDV